MSSDDKGASDKRSLIPSPRQLTARISPVGLVATPAAIADGGSVSVAGSNHGDIININAANVILAVEQQVARELPSYLSKLVAKFSEDLSNYGAAPRRTLPPEIDEKLSYNDFPLTHPFITDYLKYIHVLEAAYLGIEQRNDDARRMVRRRAAVSYHNELLKLCSASGVHHSNAHGFARSHAVALVGAVVASLTSELQTTELAGLVMQETADLAVSLIVAEAVIECEVLERPSNAATA